ncbi:MAG: calcium-translocating P-type ATPase, PMCA-type [Clostridiales bacterium]|nr:calcium-translocating P-type ATPase, PMCA-type [Clostridiales bacterium]
MSGLTPREVETSARLYGTNALTRKKQKSFLRQYLASFGDPVIRILLVALCVNLLFMLRDANWYESAGIAVAVLLATLISTLSEYGSESAFEKLQEEAANIKCRARRAGKITELPVNEIVVGDVVLIQAGERVPADGRLVSGELSVDQSALNGESKEAGKYARTDTRDGSAAGFLAPDKLFRGSVVCSGEGVMVVERVGDRTYYGGIAAETQEETIESPLKARLSQLAKTISVFGYAAAAIVASANLFNSAVIANQFNPALIAAYLADKPQLFQDFMRALTLGITVIVMAVPEGLPMMITVVLSANMRRMLKDHVLVRKLVGIETSGSLNILFTDKTGTLTGGSLRVVSFIGANGRLMDAEQIKKIEPLYQKVLANCYYNNAAVAAQTVSGGNSTDRALLAFALEGSRKIPAYEKVGIVPFNSRDKMSAAEIIPPPPSAPESGGRLFLIKGAPEVLLPHCTRLYDEKGKLRPFTCPSALKSMLASQARSAVRLLALCECGGTAPQKTPVDFRKNDLTLIGFLGIRDEVRKEARAAVSEVMGAGVQVVMVTGDNRETAVAIAAKLGLVKPDEHRRVLTSEALNRMSDAEVRRVLPDLRVIARALPSDKSRLVRLAQESGLVAGMTGDGVNDAPALKKADVGFAMGDGAEIAKEAGDIVIMDNNFASVVKAVLYGRTIFKSIRKFLIFQLTINLCAVGVSVIGPFIGVSSPVTVIQMLWINMIMDTLAGLAYAGETPLPEYMREKPKRRGEPIMNRYMYNQIVCTGLYTTAMCLMFFKLPEIARLISRFLPGLNPDGAWLFRGEERYMLTAFFALFIFAGVFNSLNARTYRLNLFSHIAGNKMFIGIMLAISLIQILLIYYGGQVFRTAGLKAGEWVIVALMALTVVFFDLARKLVLRANHRKGFI